jgi:hypothetical protein
LLQSGPQDSCGRAPTHFFRAGAAYSGDIFSGGAPIDRSIFSGGLYELSEVAPETFDAFEPKMLGNRIQIAALEDADGALEAPPYGTSPLGSFLGRFPDGLTDTTLGQPCRIQQTSDGKVRCLPEWSQQIPGFQCSRNVVEHFKPLTTCADDVDTTFTAIWRGDACTGGYEFAPFGAPLTQGGGMVGACSASSGDPRVTFYEVGTPVPPTMFAAATLVTD